MSTRSNAFLLLAITPGNASRKTYRGILASLGIKEEDAQIKIGDTEYNHSIMEEDYYEEMQIAAKEGDIVLYALTTYGYGERIPRGEMETQKRQLQEWATNICKKFQCKFEIFITANYW